MDDTDPPPPPDADPPPPACDRDGQCEPGETPEECFEDCHCGNNLCDGGEDNSTCENDCRPVCGDEVCRDGEDLECPECHGELTLRNQSDYIVWYWLIKQCTQSDNEWSENWLAGDPLDYFNETKGLIVRIGCWDMVAYGWDGYPAWSHDALIVVSGDKWTWDVYTPNKPDQPASLLSPSTEATRSTSATTGPRLTR